MPFIKPKFERRKCPCCQKMFEQRSATQIYCNERFCLAKRPAWIAGLSVARQRDAERVAAEAKTHAEERARELAKADRKVSCPECGGTKAHTPGCRMIRLAKPCYICGRPLDPNATGPDKLSRDHVVPRDVVRRQGPSYRPDATENIVLVHTRCNVWKDNRLPHHIAHLQPPWGVKPGVAKLALERSHYS